MERTIEQNVLSRCQINSRGDKGSGAAGPVDASSGTPGPRDLSPRPQTSQPKAREAGSAEITTGRRRTIRGSSNGRLLRSGEQQNGGFIWSKEEQEA